MYIFQLNLHLENPLISYKGSCMDSPDKRRKKLSLMELYTNTFNGLSRPNDL